jgi:hypothetical protein
MRGEGHHMIGYSPAVHVWLCTAGAACSCNPDGVAANTTAAICPYLAHTQLQHLTQPCAPGAAYIIGLDFEGALVDKLFQMLHKEHVPRDVHIIQAAVLDHQLRLCILGSLIPAIILVNKVCPKDRSQLLRRYAPVTKRQRNTVRTTASTTHHINTRHTCMLPHNKISNLPWAAT